MIKISLDLYFIKYNLEKILIYLDLFDFKLILNILKL